MSLLPSADFFQNQFFKKIILSETLSECQTVWIQIRTNIVSVLIWVQTVCKDRQQITKVATSKGRVKHQTKPTSPRFPVYYRASWRRYSLFRLANPCHVELDISQVQMASEEASCLESYLFSSHSVNPCYVPQSFCESMLWSPVIL